MSIPNGALLYDGAINKFFVFDYQYTDYCEQHDESTDIGVFLSDDSDYGDDGFSGNYFEFQLPLESLIGMVGQGRVVLIDKAPDLWDER